MLFSAFSSAESKKVTQEPITQRERAAQAGERRNLSLRSALLL
jgi:hypothetical protein